MDLEETKARDDCAGEDQQQFKQLLQLVRHMLRFSCREMLLSEAGS
jgi:hypothetical protein